MSYLADENGRWKQRWNDIHKIPIGERSGITPEMKKELVRLETEISKIVFHLIGENPEGKYLRNLLIDAIRDTPTAMEGFRWEIRFKSLFFNVSRISFQINESKDGFFPDFFVSHSDFKPRCDVCQGQGQGAMIPFSHVPSLEELQKQLTQTPSYIPPAVLNNLIPASIQAANEEIFWQFDEFRGKGLLDKAAQLIDDTVYDFKNKHLVDYHLWIHAMHRQKSKVLAMTYLGEITPMAKCSIETDGKKLNFSSNFEALKVQKQSRPELSKRYFIPCSQCSGEGILNEAA